MLAFAQAQPKPEPEVDLGEPLDTFDLSSLSTAQLLRYRALTEEEVVERLDGVTLAEKVERVVDVAERFMSDPRDVSPYEVSEARSMLKAMRRYDQALAPIRKLQVDWKIPLGRESDIPPESRIPWEG